MRGRGQQENSMTTEVACDAAAQELCAPLVIAVEDGWAIWFLCRYDKARWCGCAAVERANRGE